MQLNSYQTDGFYDEVFDADGKGRAEARLLLETIESLEEGEILRCQSAAESLLLQMGITFNVYGDSAGTERIFPFDLIPRIVRGDEWDWVERGLIQRIHALNEFIDDIYHDQKILKDKVIPRGHRAGTGNPWVCREGTRRALPNQFSGRDPTVLSRGRHHELLGPAPDFHMHGKEATKWPLYNRPYAIIGQP